MWFVVLGVLLVALKVAEFGAVGTWSWLWVLAPFAAAAVWWALADSLGLTKKREMAKMEAKKSERRRRNLANLGLYDPARDKKEKAAAAARRRAADKVEAKRSVIREHNEEVVRNSVLDSKQSTSFMDSGPAGPKQ